MTSAKNDVLLGYNLRILFSGGMVELTFVGEVIKICLGVSARGGGIFPGGGSE